MTCNIYAYLGGTMNHVGTNFVNQGGTLVYTSTNKFSVQASGSKQYDHICDIVYDRKKHTAKINWKGTVWTGTVRYGFHEKCRRDSETLLGSYSS